MKFTLINEHGAINRYDEAVGELLCDGLKPVFLEELTLRLKPDRTAEGTGKVVLSWSWFEKLVAPLTELVDPRTDLRITLSEPGHFVRWLYPNLIFLHVDGDLEQCDIVVQTRVKFVCRLPPAHAVRLIPA